MNLLIDENIVDKLMFVNVKEPGFKDYDGIGIIFGINNKNQYYIFYKRKERPLIDEIISGDNLNFLNKKDNRDLIKNDNIIELIKNINEYFKLSNLYIPLEFESIFYEPSKISIKKIDFNILFLGAYMIEDISICDKLYDYYNYKKKNNEVSDGCIGSLGGVLVDKNVKDSKDVSLSVILETKNATKYNNIAKAYFDLLQNVLDCYNEEYKFSNNVQRYCIKDVVNIQVYLPNGGYKKYHTERTTATEPNASRHLVFMTYLNDVTDRGETEFFHQKIKVKPKKGLTLIWPADWTFTHRGIPSPTQEKTIVTGWFNFVNGI
jgi:hypothetical protein